MSILLIMLYTSRNKESLNYFNLNYLGEFTVIQVLYTLTSR